MPTQSPSSQFSRRAPSERSGFPLGAQTPQGARVGPYRLDRELGRGGMGVVYLAARADQQYEKRVAIKLLSYGAAREQLLTRFRVERQILAKLDHPNICRMFDGGVTEDGEPYFVMEYIPGAQPIDEYCDANELSIRARLQLFRQVCSAAQYAHRFLVVHRDLKPSNVLVSRHGEAKLMDFGIAKDLMSTAAQPEESRDPQSRGSSTHAGRSMTPHYASPEQVRGEPIGTASDVYSLGVMLYELLTGCPPYQYPEGDTDALLRQICGEDPGRPSLCLTPASGRPLVGGRDTQILRSRSLRNPRQLERALQGDLDWIVHKAMQKDPQQRYASVDQLNDDIGRYLDGLPVSVAPDSLGYRVRKLIERHRIAALAAAAAFLAVTAFAVGMALLAGSIARERDTVRRERERAEQVSRFLAHIFTVAHPNELRGNAITAREILRRGVREVSTGFKDQPEVQATLWQTLGDAYRGLALPWEAAPLLERSLELNRRIHGRSSVEAAVSLYSLGSAHLAKGDLTSATLALRECLRIRERELGAASPSLIPALQGLAESERRSGRLAAAEALLRRAVALRGGLEPDAQLSRLLTDRGKLPEAEDLARSVLVRRSRAHGDVSLPVAESFFDLARIHALSGRFTLAESHWERSLEVRRKLIGNDHELTAAAVRELGLLARRVGQPARAEALLRESLEIDRRVWGDQSPSLRQGVVALGHFLQEQGRAAEAEPLLREAAALKPANP